MVDGFQKLPVCGGLFRIAVEGLAGLENCFFKRVKKFELFLKNISIRPTRFSRPRTPYPIAHGGSQ
jgi:hypothetical protein